MRTGFGAQGSDDTLRIGGDLYHPHRILEREPAKLISQPLELGPLRPEHEPRRKAQHGRRCSLNLARQRKDACPQGGDTGDTADRDVAQRLAERATDDAGQLLVVGNQVLDDTEDGFEIVEQPAASDLICQRRERILDVRDRPGVGGGLALHPAGELGVAQLFEHADHGPDVLRDRLAHVAEREGDLVALDLGGDAERLEPLGLAERCPAGSVDDLGDVLAHRASDVAERRHRLDARFEPGEAQPRPRLRQVLHLKRGFGGELFDDLEGRLGTLPAAVDRL